MVEVNLIPGFVIPHIVASSNQRKRGRWHDRTNKQTNKQTNNQRNKQTNKQTNKAAIKEESERNWGRWLMRLNSGGRATAVYQRDPFTFALTSKVSQMNHYCFFQRNPSTFASTSSALTSKVSEMNRCEPRFQTPPCICKTMYVNLVALQQLYYIPKWNKVQGLLLCLESKLWMISHTKLIFLNLIYSTSYLVW